MPTQQGQATAEGLPEFENPWVKARGLARELSDTLASIDDADRPEYAMVFPDASRGYRYGFASSGLSDPCKLKLPVDQLNDLSQSLADALDEWQDGEYMAVILPRSRSNGWPVMFGSIKSQQDLISAKAKEALEVEAAL
ncbi:hypothetical protein FHW02_002027 [Ochrobactrum sp. RH1CCR137]|nr:MULTISPECIES: hypothetical protein [unclassified Ochrobactrum]MBA8843975.1 hypothetical protein [Ochrobactrum sp. RH1CCR137]MBA8856487.1 hypothetical protein [Ochrobactrum sp. RH1CCR134]